MPVIPRKNPQSIRLSVDVSLELNNVLEEIAAELCCTKSDVLRRAIVLVDLAREARQDGKHLGVVSDPEKLDREIILV